MSPAPATLDPRLLDLWLSYWTAEPCEDFGMIPARRTRETVRPPRGTR